MYPNKKERETRRKVLNKQREAMIHTYEQLDSEQAKIRDVIFQIDTELQNVLSSLDKLEEKKNDTK